MHVVGMLLSSMSLHARASFCDDFQLMMLTVLGWLGCGLPAELLPKLCMGSVPAAAAGVQQAAGQIERRARACGPP